MNRDKSSRVNEEHVHEICTRTCSVNSNAINGIREGSEPQPQPTSDYLCWDDGTPMLWDDGRLITL